MNETVRFNFTNKTVLVFGGSRGIGKEVCIQFKKAGALVYCISRTDIDHEEITHLKCDISQEKNINSVLDKFEKIDYIVIFMKHFRK